MNKKQCGLFLYLLILLLCSCARSKLKQQIQALYHKEIFIPECLLDQISRIRLKEKLPMMVVYHDSLECASCSIKRIDEWDGILRYYADSLNSGVSSLFIFAPAKQNYMEIKSILGRYDHYPIIIDRTFAFIEANPDFPTDKRLHTFLLDADGRVIVIGSPKYDDRIWNMYKQVLEQLKNK